MRPHDRRSVLVLGLALVLGPAARGQAPFPSGEPPLPEGALKAFASPVPDYATAHAPVALAPDGKTLALGSGGRAGLWDVASGKELHRIKGKGEYVAAFAFAPDGALLAAACENRAVILWDLAASKELRRLKGHAEPVLAVAFAPDGKALASAGQDKTIILWDAATGEERARLEGHQNHVLALAFAPDGKVLASGSRDRTVRLWDVEAKKELRVLRGHQNRVNGVAFLGGGGRLASASQDSTVRLWDTATGKEVKRLGGWSGEVKAVAAAPDGRSVATVSRDYVVRVWEVLTGEERKTFRSEAGNFEALALSADGRVLATARPGAALLWDVTGLARAGAPAEVSRQELDGLWADLARDAPRAYAAVWRLAAVPGRAVPLLVERLEAQQNADDPKRIAKLIEELHSDTFAVRSRAAAELEALAQTARPALEGELVKKPSLDVRRRIEQLIERAGPVEVPPVLLRAVRGVEALERAGTDEARRGLEKLAKAPEGSRLAAEAKAALGRMKP